jgi:hypothetical protein
MTIIIRTWDRVPRVRVIQVWVRVIRVRVMGIRYFAQTYTLFLAPTIREFSFIFKFNAVFEDFIR